MIKFLTFNKGILIRIDDIAENMNWELMEKCENLFDKYKIKPVLGIIPNNHDPELLSWPEEKKFWQKVRSWQNKGWEISMHGYSHIYETETNKRDFFKLGGKSEFYGKSLKDQILKIRKGLSIFKKNEIKVRSFFAPNHTYDKNTFVALKTCGIYQVIDGYGILPYSEKGLIFIPQLFYRLFILPFALQTTQIHLNDWKTENYNNFEKFIIKNKEKIITYDFMLKNISNTFYFNIINKFLKHFLIFLRKFYLLKN